MVAMRYCEHCGASIAHKRIDARFCDRNCKMAAWHQANRATEQGRASEAVRNKARYEREAKKRRAAALAYSASHREQDSASSRAWRREHPERRRSASDRRAQRMTSNPGYCPFPRSEWERMLNRLGHRCAYCGTVGVLEQDHVVPLSRGGRHAIANILPACPGCNRSKSDSLLVEWRLRLERG